MEPHPSTAAIAEWVARIDDILKTLDSILGPQSPSIPMTTMPIAPPLAPLHGGEQKAAAAGAAAEERVVPGQPRIYIMDDDIDHSAFPLIKISAKMYPKADGDVSQKMIYVKHGLVCHFEEFGSKRVGEIWTPAGLFKHLLGLSDSKSGSNFLYKVQKAPRWAKEVNGKQKSFPAFNREKIYAFRSGQSEFIDPRKRGWSKRPMWCVSLCTLARYCKNKRKYEQVYRTLMSLIDKLVIILRGYNSKLCPCARSPCLSKEYAEEFFREDVDGGTAPTK